ncbi:hypothetical protein F5X99DRAFT_177978 [Biscogniauxia marginata]|nr:hypothetical protein F5X99DRAFT_177978 [Biscogniauxia marginata]
MPLQPQRSNSSAEMYGNNRPLRSTSDASAVAKLRLENRKWSLSHMWAKSRSLGSENLIPKTLGGKPPNFDANSAAFPGKLPSFISDSILADIQQLRKYTRKIKGISNVDTAYKEWEKIQENPREICKRLLNVSSQHREPSLVSPTTTASSQNQPESSLDILSIADTRSSISTSSLADALQQSTTQDDQHIATVLDWERCLERLSEAFRKSLLDTYNEYEQNPTPGGFEKICMDKTARKHAIQRMRNASIVKMLSADLDFFPKYDLRLRDYSQMKKDLEQIRSQLHADESESSPERPVRTHIISAGGDVMLEFANTTLPNHPIYRFRVSASMLADKSPLFRRMLNPDSKGVLDAYALPLSPTLSHSSEPKLYLMPETELNTESSLEILLHAAHGDNTLLSGDIQFSQFVAIAEVCLRYQCTSPLEFAVKELWLPQWAHKITDDMLDGFLLISYAFGLPADFIRMSQAAILNIVDEADLQSKRWPQNIKDKIGAMRRAKIDQVYDCCKALLLEYMSPSTDSYAEPSQIHNGELKPTSTPRCPKGDPGCDALNLGWMMMIFRDLGILPYIIPSATFAGLPAQPSRSLAQLVNSLRLMTSHPQSHSGVVCDFAPAFRRTIDDIHASVSGLTLFDVSGKHGWALSEGNPNLAAAHSRYTEAYSSDSHPGDDAVPRQQRVPRLLSSPGITGDSGYTATTTDMTRAEANSTLRTGVASPFPTATAVSSSSSAPTVVRHERGAQSTDPKILVRPEDKHLRDDYDQVIGRRRVRSSERNMASRDCCSSD